MKLSFDGFGINDTGAEFSPRVATMHKNFQNAETGNLLAAAPDLLRALKALVDCRDGWQTDEDYDKARAAISKAKGEAA